MEEELKRNKEIIAQYKDICNSMSERNEKNISSYREELSKFKVFILPYLVLPSITLYNLVLIISYPVESL